MANNVNSPIAGENLSLKNAAPSFTAQLLLFLLELHPDDRMGSKAKVEHSAEGQMGHGLNVLPQGLFVLIGLYRNGRIWCFLNSFMSVLEVSSSPIGLLMHLHGCTVSLLIPLTCV